MKKQRSIILFFFYLYLFSFLEIVTLPTEEISKEERWSQLTVILMKPAVICSVHDKKWRKRFWGLSIIKEMRSIFFR